MIITAVILCNSLAAGLPTSINTPPNNTAAESPSLPTPTWSQDTIANLTQPDGTIQIIIGLNNQSSNYLGILKILRQHGGTVNETINMGANQALIANVPSHAALDFGSQVASSGYARYIELNGWGGELDYAPNDPSWPVQWGLQKIGVDYAWNSTKGDKSILVAVIDSGIDYTHPDLSANYVPLGYDWVNHDSNVSDEQGHGTACAGIIAASMDNGLGIAGVSQVKIMAEKITDVNPVVYSGNTYYLTVWASNADIAAAIVHAVDAGADILSCSWGILGDISVIRDAVNYATAHNVLIFSSAGNLGDNTILQYPAGYDDVVAVGATAANNTIASSSSRGKYIDVVAPGVNIYTTFPTYHVSLNDAPQSNGQYYTMNYTYASGTSFSCPIAAGVAALIWSKYPNMTASQVRYQLESTCDDLGTPGFDIYYGNGIVNAQKALETPLPTHELVLKDWQSLPGAAENESGVQPGEPKLLSATVYNFGSNPEVNIKVQFLINGTVIYSSVIPRLATAESATINYTWTPSREGVYNITTYVQPVQGEASVLNNVYSVFASVCYKIALISDYSGLASAAGYWKVFDSIWVNYDLYNSNYFYSYTANLTLLQQYKAVIWDVDSSNRNITDAEVTALNAYLASGGNLLITTQGAVDSQLAAVIRSTVGNSTVDTSGLIVANASNPIMDGKYGHFPVGYNVSLPVSHCGNITADASRNATNLALTKDGYTKIIACSGLPGKVVFWNGGDYYQWSTNPDCAAMIQNLIVWFMDTTPPSTSSDYDGAWHNSDFTVNLSADDFFGVNQTYYRINGGATQTTAAGGQPKIVNEGSNNTLEYWSVDFNSNQEVHHYLTQIKLDKTAPLANTGGDKTVTLGESATLSGVNSYDANGIVSYRWLLGDGAQAEGATVTHTYKTIGTFTAQLTVQDAAGNMGTVVVSIEVKDKSAPAVTPTPAPTPTATPTPTNIMTTNPTSPLAPDTSSGALPDLMWVAVIAAALLCIAVGAVMVKKKISS